MQFPKTSNCKSACDELPNTNLLIQDTWITNFNSKITSMTLVCLTLFFFVVVTSCKTPLGTYIVTGKYQPKPSETLPLVLKNPVIERPEYNIMEAANEDSVGLKIYYVIPLELSVSSSNGRALQAICLTNSMSSRIILVTHITASSTLISLATQDLINLGRKFDIVKFYPVNDLTVRMLTEFDDPRKLITSHSSSVANNEYPFSLIIILQTVGRENVEKLKMILRTPAGIKTLAYFKCFVVNDLDMKEEINLSANIEFYDIDVTTMTN